MILYWVLPVTLFVVGLIHLLPAIGVFGAVRLEALYGVRITDSSTLLLLQHRAVLFGIVGVLVSACAFDRSWHVLGASVGLASMLAYLVLSWLTPSLNAALARIAMIDLLASGLLLLGLVVHVLTVRTPT